MLFIFFNIYIISKTIINKKNISLQYPRTFLFDFYPAAATTCSFFPLFNLSRFFNTIDRYTVPATLTFTFLSYPIVRVSYPIVPLSYCIVRVSYQVFRLSYREKPFIRFSVYRVSGFAFIRFSVYRVSGFAFIRFCVYHVNRNTSAFL